MSDRDVQVRIGAASAMVGALVAAVVNLLHGDLPDDPDAALTRVAATAGWGLLHLGIMASAMLILVGLWGVSQVAEGPLARAVARLSLVVALPAAADLWAAAPATDKPMLFRLAIAVEAVQNALFHTWAALFIGLPFLLMGISGVLAGGGFPRWLGLIALIGGLGALFTGVSGFLHLPVPGLLFNLFAFVVTLWVLIAGVLVWRAPLRATAAESNVSSGGVLVSPLPQ
jgi:hypothetical protein